MDVFLTGAIGYIGEPLLMHSSVQGMLCLALPAQTKWQKECGRGIRRTGSAGIPFQGDCPGHQPGGGAGWANGVLVLWS